MGIFINNAFALYASAILILCLLKETGASRPDGTLEEDHKTKLSCLEACSKDDKKRVCGEHGAWWLNACAIECFDVKKLPISLCECVDKCVAQPLQTVCTTLGVLRRNKCEADCFGDKVSEDMKLCESLHMRHH